MPQRPTDGGRLTIIGKPIKLLCKGRLRRRAARTPIRFCPGTMQQRQKICTSTKSDQRALA